MYEPGKEKGMQEDQYYDFSAVKESFIQLGEAIGKACNEIINPFVEAFSKLFGSLEPYQIYELKHPRKKPRGSKRRSKKK